MMKCLFIPAVFLSLNSTYSQSFTDSSTIKSLIQSNEASKLQIQNLGRELTQLKTLLQRQQQQGLDKFSLISSFIDAAISSANSLQILILKESYRNRIASLNNPTSNELGFNLELEIQNALKTFLQKAKKTNTSKFSQVIGSFLQTGKSGAFSLFPAGNVFTSILGMAGNLTVQEKNLEKEDLDKFISTIEKFFIQYQRLYQSNISFNSNLEKLKSRLLVLQEDIKSLIQDMVIALDKNTKRQQLKGQNIEELQLKNFTPTKISEMLSKEPSSGIQFPNDAIKGCKDVANSIQRIYDEYSLVYQTNYAEIKNIISDTKASSIVINEIQINKTLKDLETMYNESRSVDAENLRLKTLFERLDLLAR